MKKTAEMIESVIGHLNDLIASPDTTPEVRKAAIELLDHLKSDLAIVKSVAQQTLETID
jgi:hypothetical protein